MATIKTTFKSFTTQQGYYLPSKNTTLFINTTYNTTLSINSISRGYNLTCKVNGKEQESVIGTPEYTDWMLRLHAGDVVEVEVLKGGEKLEAISYSINQDGVTATRTKKVRHVISGTHKNELDIQDKYRKAAQAQQTVEVPAQIEEKTTVEAAPVAQEEIVPAQQEQTLTFGKHAGKLLSDCETSYLKWLVSHESKLLETNRWACAAAKIELEKRAQTQETKKAA